VIRYTVTAGRGLHLVHVYCLPNNTIFLLTKSGQVALTKKTVTVKWPEKAALQGQGNCKICERILKYRRKVRKLSKIVWHSKACSAVKVKHANQLDKHVCSRLFICFCKCWQSLFTFALESLRDFHRKTRQRKCELTLFFVCLSYWVTECDDRGSGRF